MCGLSVETVAERLLLSPSQVRGLESGSPKPFYSQDFFQRAQRRYARLLSQRPVAASRRAISALPLVGPAASSNRLSFDEGGRSPAVPQAVARPASVGTMPDVQRRILGYVSDWLASIRKSR